MKALALFRTAMTAIVATAIVVDTAQALDWNAKDADGAKDHPLIHRFQGSWLVGYQQIGFDAAVFPSQFGLEGMNELIKPITVEGQITRLLYLAPPGKRPYEVQKNYVTALKAAGYQETLSCSGKEKCESTSYGLDDGLREVKVLDFDDAKRANPALEKELEHVDNGSNIFGGHGEYQQMSVGTISAGGKTAHILVSSDKHYAAEITATYIQIVQPDDMPIGQVSVDLAGLQTKDKITSEIAAQGRVAIYGVYFDTGKADIKPESKPQLAEMGKYLQENPSKKVFIVGHTDNQGNFADNMKLSQNRAKAVAAYLTKEFKVDANRMVSQGVANLAPVASNSDDDGKARNRRVELVEQ